MSFAALIGRYFGRRLTLVSVTILGLGAISCTQNANLSESNKSLSQGQRETPICTDVYVPSLEIKVLDDSGNPVSGVKVSVKKDGDTEAVSFDDQGGIYLGLFEETGHFKIDVKKIGFKEIQDEVDVLGDDCHVSTVSKAYTLTSE